MSRPLLLVDLGKRGYAEALEMQRALAESRARGEGEDTLLACEHEEVVTLGRSAQRASRDTAAELAAARAAGVPVFEVERGGAATWHGPGQLVGYPIVRLEPGERDVHRFLRALEGAVASALREACGLEADPRREETPTGVWVRGKKIASIGIAVRRWVTFHGFALNLENDLSRFALIRPCDMEPGVMTSLAALGARVERGEVLAAVHRALARMLGREARASAQQETNGKVAALVRTLEIARCASFENMRAGMGFFRARSEWRALTAPEIHDELVRHVVAHGGVESMNASAREFFGAALEESARRRASGD